MAIELTMPALSPTMEKGTLAKWLVKEGDRVKAGDLIAEIETDKATMEYEAAEDGRIAKLTVAEGTEDVAVGSVIALLAGEDEAMPELALAEAAPAAARAKSPPFSRCRAAVRGRSQGALNRPRAPVACRPNQGQPARCADCQCEGHRPRCRIGNRPPTVVSCAPT